MQNDELKEKIEGMKNKESKKGRRSGIFERIGVVRNTIKTFEHQLLLLEEHLKDLQGTEISKRTKLEVARPRCKLCGSASLRYRIKTKDVFCRACGNIYPFIIKEKLNQEK